VLPRTRTLQIGRAPTNQLQLFDPYISRHHARIDYIGDSYTLTDLGSLNGVFINSLRIPPYQQVVLHAGDSIRIGDKPLLTFAFELTQSA
jgi:pSer/pThr/pTyr-binding forkhead associated (FHA) protein